MSSTKELTTKFHQAALYITPERATVIADEVSAHFKGGAVQVSQKMRRLKSRWQVEFGFVVNVFAPDGTEYYVAE